jgi:hypothetical protein
MKNAIRYFMVSGSILVVLLCIASAATACKKAESRCAETIAFSKDSTKSILFIGNSLTYYNDLPQLVAKIGKDSGIEIKAEMVAYANYALEDHWNDGRIQQLIATKNYDFVVVQQGPSSQQDGREMLLNDGARIKALCTKYNTQLAFFMVWPAVANFNTFDEVIKNYTDAAEITNSLLCPVGKVWKEHFSATSDYSYYGLDMFHPSLKGSTCAALVIFKTLFGGQSQK